MADERDPKLSQHYRDLEPLEPPPELDRRILAAARAGQGAHAPLVAPGGRHRWYFSLAAAAVLVFAVALTMHIERQQPDQEAAPAPSASAPAPQNEQARADEAKPTAPAEPFAPDPKPQAAPDSAAPAPAPAPRAPVADEMRLQREPSSPTAPARAVQSPQLDEMRARRDAAATERANAMERSAAPASAPAAARLAPERPERWLERIAELRSRGRHAEADKELAEFRRAYPDYRLSEVMRERVEGK